MNATERSIRRALRSRLDHPTDNYARDDDWIDYLSDGLADLWPGERLSNGDSVTSLDPELEAMVRAALPAIAQRCHAIAIDELTAIALDYRDRVAHRAEYRAALLSAIAGT